MRPFTVVTGVACPIGLANIDTDQLIPARFMKTPRGDGYGRFLLHDLRRDADGALRSDFPLNEARHAGCEILVTRRNFGTGSSREAAVYALVDHGIRCVIAPSFGDIFASNAVKNGLLPALVTEEESETLLAATDGIRMTVDLHRHTIQAGALAVSFSIDPARREQLLHGWDDIDLTERHRSEIDGFKRRRALTAPWVWPILG